MLRSDDRILTTHVGSLPRGRELARLLRRLDAGRLEEGDSDQLAELVRKGTAEIVRRQVDARVDVVNDGEMGKFGYSTYVKERLTGFGGQHFPSTPADPLEVPSMEEAWRNSFKLATPTCVGPVSYVGHADLGQEIQLLVDAAAESGAGEAFASAASPGVISAFLGNCHYASHEEYVFALADAMRTEYKAIVDAGLILQLDCPDLAMVRHTRALHEVDGAPDTSAAIDFVDGTLEEFRRFAEVNVEALNHAVRDLDPQRMRMHVCWGNYEGPHHLDVPLGDIVDIVLRARPAGLLFEAANPQHEHEWRLWEEVALPEDKVLVPGCIDTTTNYLEHPGVVADRIERYARVVGRERVIAGTDCGFSTFASGGFVDPEVVWWKLRSLAEGAQLASERLWA
ncbi:MAG: cobalamin-independent methionine synthase II family protein [Acidimicrobiia bacterium]